MEHERKNEGRKRIIREGAGRLSAGRLSVNQSRDKVSCSECVVENQNGGRALGYIRMMCVALVDAHLGVIFLLTMIVVVESLKKSNVHFNFMFGG